MSLTREEMIGAMTKLNIPLEKLEKMPLDELKDLYRDYFQYYR